MGTPGALQQPGTNREYPTGRNQLVTPADYLRKARRAITSARLLLADDDREGACNRAYYAKYYAAHAALLDADSSLNPASTKTHRGLIAAFGEQLIKTGRLSAEIGRSLEPSRTGAAIG